MAQDRAFRYRPLAVNVVGNNVVHMHDTLGGGGTSGNIHGIGGRDTYVVRWGVEGQMGGERR